MKWPMASSDGRRFAQALAQIFLPLVILPLGLLVTIAALGYFTPLVKLIKDLS